MKSRLFQKTFAFLTVALLSLALFACDTEIAAESDTATSAEGAISTERPSETVAETMQETGRESDSIAETVAETEPETDEYTETQNETETQHDAYVESESETVTDQVTDFVTETESETGSETETETETESEIETKTETESETEVVRTEPLAKDFIVYDADGNTVRLSDFLGKPIVLNFWASWCGPCKSEMPEFNEKYLEMGDEVQFLMVNLTAGDSKEDADELIAKKGYSFPVYYDTAYSAANAYGVQYIPMTVFIDSEGYIMASEVGALSGEKLTARIELIKQ